MRKIRTGDKVKVITGDYKGQKGVVKKVVRKKARLWFIVEGINKVKKHIKKGLLGKDAPGGIIEVEAPIDASNVMLVCPVCGKPTRVAIKVKEDGKKVRVCKKCGAEITNVPTKEDSKAKIKKAKKIKKVKKN